MKRRRRLQTPSATEDVVGRSGLWTKRPAHVRLRMTHMHALTKVNPQSRRKEVLDNAECNETMSQPQLSSDHWTAVEMHDTETKDEWPLKWRSSNVHKEKPLAEGEKEEDKTEMESSDQHSWSSGERTSDVREEIEKSSKFSHSNEEPSKQFAATVTEKPTLPLCQVSLETVEFDRGEGHLICKQKSAEFSLLDILSERLVSIVKFLDRKMVKYLVSASSAGSYVVLVRRQTKSKAATTVRDDHTDCNFDLRVCNRDSYLARVRRATSSEGVGVRTSSARVNC